MKNNILRVLSFFFVGVILFLLSSRPTLAGGIYGTQIYSFTIKQGWIVPYKGGNPNPIYCRYKDPTATQINDLTVYCNQLYGPDSCVQTDIQNTLKIPTCTIYNLIVSKQSDGSYAAYNPIPTPTLTQAPTRVTSAPIKMQVNKIASKPQATSLAEKLSANPLFYYIFGAERAYSIAQIILISSVASGIIATTIYIVTKK